MYNNTRIITFINNEAYKSRNKKIQMYIFSYREDAYEYEVYYYTTFLEFIFFITLSSGLRTKFI